MSPENNRSIDACLLGLCTKGVEGHVCANYLHLCILFYLDLVSRLQLVLLSITVTNLLSFEAR